MADNDIVILQYNSSTQAWEHGASQILTPVEAGCITFDASLVPQILPLAYGSIKAFENASTTSMTGSGTYDQILEFTADGSARGVTPAYASGDLTVVTTGVYRVSFSISVTCAVGTKTLDVAVKKNNGATDLNIATRREIGSAAYGVVGASDYASLTATDTIELWAALVEAGATNITMRHGTLMIERIE